LSIKLEFSSRSAAAAFHKASLASKESSLVAFLGSRATYGAASCPTATNTLASKSFSSSIASLYFSLWPRTQHAHKRLPREGLGHRGGVLRGFIQDPANGLRRIPLPRTRVNKGKGKGRGCLEPQSSGSRSLKRATSCFGPRFLAEPVEASDYLDPFVILIIQHDTDDELCAVRRRLSSEEPGDALEDALPPGVLCGLLLCDFLSGVALERRHLDCSFIYW
jgi:hypothetical protein